MAVEVIEYKLFKLNTMASYPVKMNNLIKLLIKLSNKINPQIIKFFKYFIVIL